MVHNKLVILSVDDKEETKVKCSCILDKSEIMFMYAWDMGEPLPTNLELTKESTLSLASIVYDLIEDEDTSHDKYTIDKYKSILKSLDCIMYQQSTTDIKFYITVHFCEESGIVII